MKPRNYRAAAKFLRLIADRLDKYADPKSPREKASLTRIIHILSRYGRALSDRHHYGERPKLKGFFDE